MKDIGARIGDLLNIRVPLMLDAPFRDRGKVHSILTDAGFQNVKCRGSGNRGILGLQRYLDIYVDRADYWPAAAVLRDKGYRFRHGSGYGAG